MRTSIVHTGQHYDRAMSEVFFEELGVPEPDNMLGVGSGSHAEQTARVLERLEPVLERERPELVLVPGDVNSTLAAALCAQRLGIPVGHVESGLRSFDRTMPEEINRVVADHVSELLFLHSDEAIENLGDEGIGRGAHAVRRQHDDRHARGPSRPLRGTRRRPAAASSSRGSYLLVTLHRPALVDTPLLAEATAALADVAAEIPVVFPVHPRTRKMMGADVPPGLRLVDPVGYLDFLSLEASAGAVLTDSGGIQEETTFLGVPCFTLRDNTERPVTVRAGTNTLLGLDPNAHPRDPRPAGRAPAESPAAAGEVGWPRGVADRRCPCGLVA